MLRCSVVKRNVLSADRNKPRSWAMNCEDCHVKGSRPLDLQRRKADVHTCPWKDCYQILHSCRSRARNHLWQIFWRSVKGRRFCGLSKMECPHWRSHWLLTLLTLLRSEWFKRTARAASNLLCSMHYRTLRNRDKWMNEWTPYDLDNFGLATKLYFRWLMVD